MVAVENIGLGSSFSPAATTHCRRKTMQRYEICKLELKYCELCGGLWIRVKGSAITHCPGCNDLVAQLAPPRDLQPCRTGRRS
jgi:ribosomal protein L37AE/L43A